MREQVWVVGRSGMLGSAIARAARDARHFDGQTVPWGDPERAVATLRADVARFRTWVDPALPWSVLWCAGAAVIGSDQAQYERETAVLTGFVGALAEDLPPGDGAFFYASSASVHAGGPQAPFSESSPVAPTSRYAEAKVAQEQAVSAALGGHLPHVVGRISTLYGPGQDLTKPQGIISRMCLQAATGGTIAVFVPLDTRRDYLYVDDAAAVVRRLVDAARRDGDTTTRVRIVARGAALSIAQVAALTRQMCRRRLRVHQIVPAANTPHVLDLRVRTEHEHESAGVRWTPASVGVSAVYADIVRRLLAGELSGAIPRT
jgi:UDP-glucose 4-epimerase